MLGDADRQLAVAPFEIIIKRSIYLSEVQLFSFQLRYSGVVEAKHARNFLNCVNILYHAACTVPVLPEVVFAKSVWFSKTQNRGLAYNRDVENCICRFKNPCSAPVSARAAHQRTPVESYLLRPITHNDPNLVF